MQGRIRVLFGTIILLTWTILANGCSGGSQPNVVSAGSSNSQQIPFTESKPVVVPADTMIYVHLQDSVTSGTAKAGQTFSAVLDEPLVVDDQPVVQPGAPVTGTVVAARASGRVNTAGYVRVVISSITVNGKAVPVQTASVIAGGASIHNHNLSFTGSSASSLQETSQKAQAGFAAGQRLSFRLTQPLSF